MRRLSFIRNFLLGLAGFLAFGQSGAAMAKKEKTVLVADTVFVFDSLPAIWAAGPAEAFIRTGEMVAERDIVLFTADLLDTYKILKKDERNLTRLFMRCDRNWGATAYALALQAASRVPMRVVLMNFDAAGRNWERTAVGMGLIYKGNCQPSYTFGIYLNRQLTVWYEVLEAPLRWRRTYLGR